MKILKHYKKKAEWKKQLKDALGNPEAAKLIEDSTDQLQSAFLQRATALKEQGRDPMGFAQEIQELSSGYYAETTSVNFDPTEADIALDGFRAAVSLKGYHEGSHRTSLIEQAKSMVGLLTQKFRLPPAGK